MFLYCPSLIPNWQRVMDKIMDSHGTDIRFNPVLCLLNSLKGNERISVEKAQWLKVALTAAERVTLRH